VHQYFVDMVREGKSFDTGKNPNMNLAGSGKGI